MHTHFLVVHRQQKSPWNFKDQTHPWMQWTTCLRQVIFGRDSWLSDVELHPSDEVLTGEAAYRFCLEVVSGLHSPMVGETEVFGQFRQLVDNYQFPNSAWGSEFRALTQQIISDVKTVRQRHLTGLGSQSYGSVARRRMKDLKQINLIGAGLLTRDMLPWLVKSAAHVRIHCRNPLKAQDLLQQYPQVQIEALTDSGAPIEGGVVIAAPISAADVQVWLQRLGGKVTYAMDLRGESTHDPLLNGGLEKTVVEDLASVFSAIEATREQLQTKLQAAHRLIDELVSTVGQTQKVRPFGWDDLCA